MPQSPFTVYQRLRSTSKSHRFSNFTQAFSGSLKLQSGLIQARDIIDGRPAAMDPNSVTAVTPFRLLDLPREVRDDIYEAAILDLSPPDMFADPYPEDPDSLGLRKMDTNILLTSRQVYWEARDVVVRRAQLIMVSIWCWDFDEFVDLLKTVPVIAGIDPMYRNLCIMSHRSMYQILICTSPKVETSSHLCQ